MSQLGADLWVLSYYNNQPGFFLDVGCADAENISNTFLLEKNGWRGICIDAFPRNFTNRPKSTVVQAVLSDVNGKEVEFVAPTNDPDLSGIKNTLNSHKERVLSQENKSHKFITQKLSDILDTHNAPKFIDYCSMDIEGGEYDVLKTFDFKKYAFGLLSIEHNYTEPTRTQIKEILNKNGYSRYKSVEFDDWYIKID